MRFADVTLTDGTILGPVAVHQDSTGLRFYAADRGRIYVLGTIVGGEVREWGTKTIERDAQGRRTAVRRAAVIVGDLPPDFASIAYRGGCQCGHVLKNYRPPFDWEPVA